MTGDPPLLFSRSWRQLQGPSPGPETLAWPPNYHYGGSPFRARGPLLGTKLLGRGPARRSPLYLLLLPASFFSPSFLLYILLFSLGRSTHKYLLLPLSVSFDSTGVYQHFCTRASLRKQKSVRRRIESFMRFEEI